jgi:hypothetical protein
MLLGADPELFVFDINCNPINAYKVLKNSKSNPIIKDNCQFFYDNVTLEFNFPPAKNEMDFKEKIKNCLFFSCELVAPCKLVNQGSVDFDDFDKKNSNFYEIGCDPDLDAYSLSYNKIQKDFLYSSLTRYAGGHLHIGGGENDVVTDNLLKPIFVYMLDLFLGIPCVLLDHGVDSFKRKNLYGKAGTYRNKPYGLEYRVLSPFWLRSRSTVSLIWNICEFVFNFMNNHDYKKFWHFDYEKLKQEDSSAAYECYGYDCGSVSKCISNNDLKMAEKFYSKFIVNFMPEYLINQIEEEKKFKAKNLHDDWDF